MIGCVEQHNYTEAYRVIAKEFGEGYFDDFRYR